MQHRLTQRTVRLQAEHFKVDQKRTACQTVSHLPADPMRLLELYAAGKSIRVGFYVLTKVELLLHIPGIQAAKKEKLIRILHSESLCRQLTGAFPWTSLQSPFAPENLEHPQNSRSALLNGLGKLRNLSGGGVTVRKQPQ
jgi:hypothetical protein